MAWKYYCPKCKRIINRFQVAYGDDGCLFHWHRCRACGSVVRTLKEVLETVLADKITVQEEFNF